MLSLLSQLKVTGKSRNFQRMPDKPQSWVLANSAHNFCPVMTIEYCTTLTVGNSSNVRRNKSCSCYISRYLGRWFVLLLVFIYFMSLYFPCFESLLSLYCWLSKFSSDERKGNLFFQCCCFHVCNFNLAYLFKSIYVICFLRSDCHVGTLHLRLCSLHVCNYFCISEVWYNFSCACVVRTLKEWVTYVQCKFSNTSLQWVVDGGFLVRHLDLFFDIHNRGWIF